MGEVPFEPRAWTRHLRRIRFARASAALSGCHVHLSGQVQASELDVEKTASGDVFPLHRLNQTAYPRTLASSRAELEQYLRPA
jgi:hypothetical protein